MTTQPTDRISVLESIREPTAEMLQGACDKHIPGRPMHDTTRLWPDECYRTEEECPRFVARRNIWRSMIDVAIAEARASQEQPHG